MKIKQKQEAEKAAMAIFYSKCKRKHAERERPLNSIEICGIYTLEHHSRSAHDFPAYRPSTRGVLNY